MQFDNKVSLGNLLTLLAMIVAAVAGYSTLQAELNTHRDQINALDRAVVEQDKEVRALQDQTESRLRAIEVLQASQTSDLKNIREGILDIKAALDRLAEKGAK